MKAIVAEAFFFLNSEKASRNIVENFAEERVFA